MTRLDYVRETKSRLSPYCSVRRDTSSTALFPTFLSNPKSSLSSLTRDRDLLLARPSGESTVAHHWRWAVPLALLFLKCAIVETQL